MQATADNIDHNAKILDDRNTFHGMGIIGSVTPKIKSTTVISRLCDVPSGKILKLAHIESQTALPCCRPNSLLKSYLIFQHLTFP